jgi:hypothetical protein
MSFSAACLTPEERFSLISPEKRPFPLHPCSFRRIYRKGEVLPPRREFPWQRRTIPKISRRKNGKQGMCGLDWFTERRQGRDLDGDGRVEQRELLFRLAL